MIRKDCRWYLRYGGHHFCRCECFEQPEKAPKDLDLGCDCNPDTDYQPQPWKKGRYPDDVAEAARIVEWDDEG